ncbi:MAG: biotin--[acetyl-CoA-carboxylase] ligase [Alphaproteobacteria bacterium]
MSRPVQGPSLPDGYDLRIYDDLDGTNAEALRAGCLHGIVIVARRQTAGRGRQQRVWLSPPGNLYVTICVEPPDIRIAGQLAFVSALAVLDTVSEMAPDAVFSLKWPNDVLCAGRKLSGILIETGESGGFAVGIGINLAHAPPDDEVRFPATSLEAVSGRETQPDAVIEPLCRHFDHWYRRWQEDGFEPLRAVWLASAHGIGDTIAASTGSGRIEGRFEGLDDDGTLILTDAGGNRHAVTAGDVFFPQRTD